MQKVLLPLRKDLNMNVCSSVLWKDICKGRDSSAQRFPTNFLFLHLIFCSKENKIYVNNMYTYKFRRLIKQNKKKFVCKCYSKNISKTIEFIIIMVYWLVYGFFLCYFKRQKFLLTFWKMIGKLEGRHKLLTDGFSMDF
jgi:hypothetical protein